MVRVRPYEPSDRDFVVGLAPRLTIGIPIWRDERLMLATVQRWISHSISRRGETAEVFVAVDEEGRRMGFASVADETHFTGEVQAYIGELVVHPAAEGTGVGTALVSACEQWARRRGHRILSLSTGSANSRALALYRHLGFADEDVKLVKRLERAAPPEPSTPKAEGAGG
jgi:GNAT superfamily N-acetyltransferase